MTSSYTVTQTYTVADIGKVLDCFAADYDGMAQSTGLRDDEHVRKACADVKLMALRQYLTEINIALLDRNGNVVRAAKYEVSAGGGILRTHRPPGNFLWPRLPGGNLHVIVQNSATWENLAEWKKRNFRDELHFNWTPTTIDTSFPGLARSADRDYSSNGYSLLKSTYT
jgi:hypothetical protein